MSHYTELTFVSDDCFSNEHFPNNTLNHFSNIFDHCLRYENGEMAIKKVTFVNTMFNIFPPNNAVYFCNVKRAKLSGVQKFELPKIRCESQQHFLNVLNDVADHNIPNVRELKTESGTLNFIDNDMSPYPHFRYKIINSLKVYLHQDILKLMGYDNLLTTKLDPDRPDDVPDTHFWLPNERDIFDGVNQRVMNFQRNDPTLVFSCSMTLGTHLYGHKKVRSMLEVPTSNLSNDLTTYSPTHLAFYPLSRKDFVSATITINTRDGQPAPLVYGPVLVECVIRERESTHSQL